MRHPYYAHLTPCALELRLIGGHEVQGDTQFPVSWSVGWQSCPVSWWVRWQSCPAPTRYSEPFTAKHTAGSTKKSPTMRYLGVTLRVTMLSFGFGVSMAGKVA